MTYLFEDFRVEVEAFRVTRNEQPVALEAKALETLIFLLERRGRLVTKNQLLDAVWSQAFVTPNALTRIITQLRRELGDTARNSRIIETVPTRGYRFIAEVEKIGETAPPPELPIPEKNSAPIIDDRSTIAPFPATEKTAVQSKAFKYRYLLAFAAAAVCIVAAFIAYRSFFPAGPKTADRPRVTSIAVLPFKITPAGKEETQFLSVGLANAVISRLSISPQLTVRPIDSVIKYGAGNGDAKMIAAELRVETILEGSIVQTGDRARVETRLIRAVDGAKLWEESYETDLKDSFRIEDAVAGRVVNALNLQFTKNERERFDKRPTEDIEAYRLYLLGNFHLGRLTREDHDKARQYFQQAIARDPSFALAWVSLSRVYALGLATDAQDGESAKNKTQEALIKASSLDPTLAEVQALTGAFQFWSLHKAPLAKESFQRAVVLDPNSVLAHNYYAWFLAATGKFDAAKEHLNRALEIDPLSVNLNADQSMPYFYQRNYEAARTLAQKAVDLDGNVWIAHLRLAQAYEGLGKYELASGEYLQAQKLQAPRDVRALLARSLALEGKTAEARKLLSEAIADPDQVSPFYNALAYTALGENETAFEWLNKSKEANERWFGWINVEPGFDPLRADPRFAELVEFSGAAGN